MRRVYSLMLLGGAALSAALLAACPADGPRALGAACARDAQCGSGLCYPGRCLAPAGDEDGDGLSNAVEHDLRSDPDHADSDGDGLADLAEVGDDPTHPKDGDGDGIPDVLESAVADADLDCLSDQIDPDDGHKETDLAFVARAVCRTRGVCADGLVTAVCLQLQVDGAPTSRAGCDYTAVPGFDGGVEVHCDGLDNDCDGRTDEDLGYLEAGGVVRALSETCIGTGVCAMQHGVVECSPGGRAVCSVNAGGSVFAGAIDDIACDAADNNCDGQTDEGVSWTNPRTGGVRHFGEPCVARGVCGLAGGVVECAAGTGDGICSTEPGASDDRSAPEVCDGADNDCDGLTDEELRYDAGGGAQLPLGAPCGLGVCAGGEVVCGSSGKPVCSTAGRATTGIERCDGLDEDCDGLIDEADGLAPRCPSAGVCAALTLLGARCGEDGALVCDFAPGGAYTGPVEAACDGRDDNCDGTTDEGFETAAGLALGAPCSGQGACAGAVGTVVCAPPGDPDRSSGAVCSADLYGTPEACDGYDDDCDGVTDEPISALPGGGVCATLGVCAAATAPPVCHGGAWACGYASDPTWEPVESRCDGRDNDCDGQTDEGLPRAPSGAVVAWTGKQPPARGLWPAVAGGGAVWLFGGAAVAAPGATPPLLGDLWRYDVAARSWSRIDGADPPAPRAGHAVAWLPGAGRLVVHGGFSAASVVSTALSVDGVPDAGMWVFDPVTARWAPVAQAVDGIAATSLARRYHALVAVGAAELLLVGGLSADDPVTGASSLAPPAPALFGTLAAEVGANGQTTWRCSWSELDAGPPWRAGATLASDPATGAVALVGGLGAVALRTGGGGVAAPWGAWWSGAQDTAWVPFDGPADASKFGLTPGAALSGTTLVVAGMAGSWRRTLPNGPWEPLTGTPPGPSGPLFTDGAGGWRLLVADAADVPGRRTLKLEAGADSWTLEGAWGGPEPRVGAALVLAPESGVLRLIGGARADGVALADAWRLGPGTGSWIAELAPSAVAAAEPGLAGALAVWDAAAPRAVLVGGTKAPAAEARVTLYLPGQGLVPAVTSGPAPPAFERAALACDPAGDAAWLLVAGGDGALGVWRLDLDVLAWSHLAPTPAAGAGTPAAADGPFTAGFRAGGLRVAPAEGPGVAGWCLALNPPAWGAPIRVDLAQALGPAAAALWDDAGGAALFVAPGAGAAQVVRVDPIAPSHYAVALSSPYAPGAAAWVVDPARGLVAFGGRSDAGVVATTWLYPLVCVAP